MNLKEIIDGLYVTPEEAALEISSRRSNKELMKKVEDFYGSKFPSFMNNGPYTCLVRMAFTDVAELDCAILTSQKIGLPLNILEYDAKFVSKNIDMYTLGTLLADPKTVVRGRKKFFPITNFNKWEGKMFSEVETYWGEKLLGFHHRMLATAHPDLHPVPFSDWFNETRTMGKEYYSYYLSLFICHGVLLEDFYLDDNEEREFFEEKVAPSINNIFDMFGVRPLIISIDSQVDDPDSLGVYPPKMVEEAWTKIQETKLNK